MEFPFPNREHEVADKAARRRALRAIEDLEAELKLVRQRLELGAASRVDADTVQSISDYARRIVGHAAELGVLYDVREWHATDVAESRIVEVR